MSHSEPKELIRAKHGFKKEVAQSLIYISFINSLINISTSTFS